MRIAKTMTAVSAVLAVSSHGFTMADPPQPIEQSRGKAPPSAVLDAVRKHPPATPPTGLSLSLAIPADPPTASALDMNLERWRTAYVFAEQGAAHLEGRTGIDIMLGVTAEAIAQSKALRERLRQLRAEQERLAMESPQPPEPDVPASASTRTRSATDEGSATATTRQVVLPLEDQMSPDTGNAANVEVADDAGAAVFFGDPATAEPTFSSGAGLFGTDADQITSEEIYSLLVELRQAHAQYALALERLITSLEQRMPASQGAGR